MTQQETTLLAAAISALVAFATFAFTQYLTFRRERTRLLTEKLESLYILISEEQNLFASRTAAYAKSSNLTGLEAWDLVKLVQMSKSIMLTRFYLIGLSADIIAFKSALEKVHESVIDGEAPRDFAGFKVLLDDVDEKGDLLRRRIILEYEELVKTSKGSAATIWDRISYGN